MSFFWKVQLDQQWPPKRVQKDSYGPSSIETIRSCALRYCFECSEGYEKRISFNQRIGIAFHRTLESIARKPPGGSSDQVVEFVRDEFRRELAEQDSRANMAPRERRLPRSSGRIDLALEALIVLAHRIGGRAGAIRPREEVPTTGVKRAPMVEVPVFSHDGTLKGRVDRVEFTPAGPEIIEYKSTLREDLAEQYIRQVRMYTTMWFDTHGEWPTAAYVSYPLKGTLYEVSVPKEECLAAVDEARALIKNLETAADYESLANPGPDCKFCDFRPWCAPFWSWQRNEVSSSKALERAVLGFEAIIVSVDEVPHYTRLLLSWRDATVRVFAPTNSFSHLKNLPVGATVRVLDMHLKGLRHQPKGDVDDYTEIFSVC